MHFLIRELLKAAVRGVGFQIGREMYRMTKQVGQGNLAHPKGAYHGYYRDAGTQFPGYRNGSGNGRRWN